MADEVPICDVLCEAMEYLSKLGSNLRARSESLKEKRIRKDKLKNSHAVQKAADKVLLICELSKKSLENVECGVRKVLSLVGESRQGPSSAAAETTSEVKRTDDVDKYQYFRHQSRTLKICKKVPVRHYMSAKVLARTMPVLMQDKYPVYYNCKLYRQRKRIQRVQKVKELEAEISMDANESNIERVTTGDILPSNENNVTSDLATPTIECESTENCMKIKDPTEITEALNQNINTLLADENQHMAIEAKGRKQKAQSDYDSDNHSINSQRSSKIKKNDERIFELSKKAQNDSSDEDIIKKTSKRNRRLKVINDDSSDDSNGPLIKQSQSNKKENDEDTEDCDRSSSKKVKLNKPIEEENEIIESDITASLNQSDVREEKSVSQIDGVATDSVRPVIKCVSLTKLLKPDVLEKNEEDLPLKKVKKSSLKQSEDQKEQLKHGGKTKLYKSEKKKRSHSCKNEDDEEFWAEKRKEVSAFKPKGVIINITRLPKLSLRFLEAHKLYRITQNDLVICELEKNKIISGKDQSTTKNKVDNIHNIKNALLNDSDSEKSFSSGPKSPLNVDEIIKTITSVLSNESNDDLNIISKNSKSENCDSNNDVVAQETSHNLVSEADTVEAADTSINNINNEKNIEDNKKSCGELNIDSSTSAEAKLKSTNPEGSDSDKNTEGKTCKKNDTIHNETIEKKKLKTNHTTGNLKSDAEVKSGKNKQTSSGETRDNLDKDTHKTTDYFDSEKHDSDLNEKFQNIDDIEEHDIEKCDEIKQGENALVDNSNSEKEENNLKNVDADSSKNKDVDIKKIEDNDENTLKNALLYDTDSEKEECNINKTGDECKEVIDSISGTDKVKNALLDDSDSEKDKETAMEKIDVKNVDSKEAQNPEQIKNALLHESGSEHENSNFQFSTKTFDGDPPNMELHTSDHEPKKNNEHHQEIKKRRHKSSKMNVRQKSISTDDGLKTPPSKRKKHKHGNTPKWKKKHMMESIHAKKMLLTYSSSSETEDEQLKSALKEIKDFLMKGGSSDDEKSPEKSCTKRASSSSDSDPDILNDFKKKKQPVDDKDDDKDDSISEKRDHSENESKISEELSSKHSNKSDDSMDAISNSSSKKMGRSRAQPGGSSQNSDSPDTNDKDIDCLTNLNNLSKNRRRRGSTSTQNTEITDSSSSRRSRKMPRAPLIEDVVLKADSSSEAPSASGAESDGEEREDLPPVTLPGLNGSGVDHLAKDDLLDESDSSSSHNEETKNGSDGDENSVKSKRRKGHAISSDSEAGSSRKKDLDVKLSDFEDSEDDLDLTKKSKRKKKANDSDSSLGSSSNESSKKKRRRIKQLNDSDGSGSDSENEGRNKHGRKNIRKVMSKNQLEEATKKAAREEKERIARIAERQKLYNNLEFDESGKPDEVVLEKVVLDFDPETKEPLIQVDKGLVKKLKPHQANGIKFMWDACFESVKRIKKDKGSGCILAHCMGLGKTLQVVSLTHTLLIHGDLTTVNRVLVVCPLSTVLNWVNEYRMWLKHAETDYDVEVYELSRYKQNSERAFQLQQWLECGGVCVLGYEMFRNLSADNPKKYKKKMLRSFQEALVDPGPDLVVCDEGHLLKNEKTSLSQSMNRVRTRRRIVLTGTPLQNNLKEYYCMVQFVKPNLLGKYNEYLNRFVNPITNGQYTDSTEHDIRIMKRRSHVLHKMLDGAVQRRDYGVLAPFLPPKHEYVLFITLSEVQIKLYQFYLDNYSRRPLPGKSSGFLFPDFQSLQRIWTHPLVLKYNSERYEIMQQKKREREEEEDSEGSLADFIDDDSTPDESSTDESTSDLSDVSDDSRKKSKKKKSPKKSKAKDTKVTSRRATRANPMELEDEVPNEVVELKAENPTEWWIKLVTEDELEDMRHSHKLILLFEILRQCETIGDKLLVFSQSLYSLDLIEHFLGKVDEATQEGRVDEKLGGHVGSWSPGVDYFRLDGSTSCENRSIWCKNFNREDNPRARLFLISTRAGGLGINLVAANRVVIFDVSWNPSHDVQSIFRVYRFGQKKPCYVYRFLAMGTMEEKIYERQVTKQAISKRVIDEQQIDRHYAENDLAELYKFEARPPTPRPLPPLPKDRLFAEMLKEHEVQIYKYHEHDSLLENKEEETLSEEERKAAWEDFENEKNRPPPAPFPNAWPMHNGMVPGLLAQQQQQLAYAALAAMLRKDMPNINDNQIRDMLPLIYNANPALMQKMTDIYKYAPPGGMMNPGMMNPVMNSGPAGGGGAGGAMGGSSGLQYEPPWQRQHQQQQQMRLQQLMQQQSQMGAKYYAGGLGSRDPVAMALQQQRAREIMTGEARGRPRGRPPLQPRAPLAAPAAAPVAAPAAAGDVVDLDSD